jgi:hypothetical protein
MYDDLRSQITNTQERWLTFLQKLENRAKELHEAAFTELANLRKTDKKAHYKMLFGVCGQFEAIRSKAYDTKESEITDLYYCLKDDIGVSHPLFETLYKFRNICYERFDDFEKTLNGLDQSLRDDSNEDLEGEYQKILKNAAKEKFFCSQCGHPLVVERIFFIAVHIACGACGSQNTLEPSSHARSLQYIAKDLAAKRCKHLLTASENEKQKERDLYMQAHKLKLSAIHESDKEVIQKKIDAINLKRDEALKNSRRIYGEYLRAYCDEMNKMLPDFKDHHEKIYLRQINQT